MEARRRSDSYTYHWGYLLDYALQEGLIGPEAGGSRGGGGGDFSAGDVRTAIERACQEAPIRPVERAVSTTLRQSRAALLSAASRVGTSLRGAATAGRSEEPAQDEHVSGVAALLQRRIASAVPEAHFRQLRGRFRAHLPEAGGTVAG